MQPVVPATFSTPGCTIDWSVNSQNRRSLIPNRKQIPTTFPPYIVSHWLRTCRPDRLRQYPWHHLPHPGMLQTLLRRKPLSKVHHQHVIDEIQGRVADFVPVWRRIVEPTLLDLLGERIGKVFAVHLVAKGRKATQADVHDDAAGPDIYRESVCSLFGFLKYLGGHV